MITIEELELLLKQSNNENIKEDKPCYPFTANEMQRAEGNASLYDFIKMVGIIVENTMEDLKVKYLPEKQFFTLIKDPDYNIDYPFITYKVKSRTHKDSYKHTTREYINETCDKQERSGTVYGQRFDCYLQFNICASEEELAWKVMERFEELMIAYAGHIKKQGIVEYYFNKQFTDVAYSNFRETFSVLNLEYYIEIEKLLVIFKENIKDIHLSDVSETNNK